MNSKQKEQQFKELYEAHTDMIFRFCITRVSDREQAMDIVQETFMRLWKTIQHGEVVDNTKAFLFTIAHRLIIDWYRKKKAISIEDMGFEDEAENYEPVEDGVKIDMENAAEGRYLLDKINSLSTGSRTVLYLRYAEGLTPPDIGKIIGVSANAASVRISRGLDELRKISGYREDK